MLFISDHYRPLHVFRLKLSAYFSCLLQLLTLRLSILVLWSSGARGSAADSGTALQATSIPDGVTAVFHNPSGRTMTLGSTLSLTAMNTGNISWGVKAAATIFMC